MPHVGQRAFHRLAVLIRIGLILEQIDIALHPPVLHIGHHEGADHRSEPGLEFLENLVKIGVFVVQFVDEEQLGNAFFGCGVKGLFRPHGHTAFAGHHNNGAAGRAEAFAFSARKIKESGGVQQVHLGVLPFHRQERQGNRGLPPDFLRIEVAHGIAVRHPAQPVGFAGAGMAGQRHVADVLRGVLFQCLDSPFL